jgi:hypothetical protein
MGSYSILIDRVASTKRKSLITEDTYSASIVNVDSNIKKQSGMQIKVLSTLKSEISSTTTKPFTKVVKQNYSTKADRVSFEKRKPQIAEDADTADLIINFNAKVKNQEDNKVASTRKKPSTMAFLQKNATQKTTVFNQLDNAMLIEKVFNTIYAKNVWESKGGGGT